MSNKNNSSGGLGLGMVLFLIFMTLKLTGNITWSWWYVTLPLWGPISLLIILFTIVAIIKGRNE
jgi:hypothetical protein